METVYNRFNNFLPSEAELRTTIVIEATIETLSYQQKCDVRNAEDAVIGSSYLREVDRAGALGDAAACSLAKVQEPTRRAGAWNCVRQQTRPRRPSLPPGTRRPASRPFIHISRLVPGASVQSLPHTRVTNVIASSPH